MEKTRTKELERVKGGDEKKLLLVVVKRRWRPADLMATAFSTLASPLPSHLLPLSRTSKLPRSLAPPGLFFAPLSACQIPPPTAPIPNAPPTSSRMRSGHGSRLWSTEGPPWGGGGAAIVACGGGEGERR